MRRCARRWGVGGSMVHAWQGARVGSFDTDACGVLLRMKLLIFQVDKNSFMLSSQPQAGVSKHPARLRVPGRSGARSSCEGRVWWRARSEGPPATSSPSPSSHCRRGMVWAPLRAPRPLHGVQVSLTQIGQTCL